MLTLVELIEIVGDYITPYNADHLAVWNGWIDCFGSRSTDCESSDYNKPCLHHADAFWIDGNPYCLVHLNRYVEAMTRN